jgi:hypothetical protein
VIDVVAHNDLAQRIACRHTLQGLADLVLGQLAGIDIIGVFGLFGEKPPDQPPAEHRKIAMLVEPAKLVVKIATCRSEGVRTACPSPLEPSRDTVSLLGSISAI